MRRLLTAATLAIGVGMSVLAGCHASSNSPGIRRAASVYDDAGEAPGSDRVRALVSLRLRDRAGLDALVGRLYETSSPEHGRYMAAADVTARFAPTEDDLGTLASWAASHGLLAARHTTNRLLVELTGTVADFGAAFDTRLHVYVHKTSQDRVYGTPDGLTIPDLAAFDALASLDVGADDGDLAKAHEAAPGPVPALGLAPSVIASAYRLDRLTAAGSRGRGASIGVVTGGGFNDADARAFWKAFDVTRAEPVVRDLMEKPATRVFEATFDVEWAGALAPDADVVVFQSADTHTTSLLFAFTEAATSGEVSVVTNSYAHRESSEPQATRALYDLAAELGAATGTTVVAAAGDTGKPDLPATCPFVTAVGGTTLTVDASGAVHEEAWERTGAGPSSFPAPVWQRAVVGDGAPRAVSDVALNAGSAYVALYRGEWRATGGTSVSSPVFAAIVALVDGVRRDAGRPPVGFLNAALYGSADVQRTFRDITTGGTTEFAARVGWDEPTGWGAPDAEALAAALP